MRTHTHTAHTAPLTAKQTLAPVSKFAAGLNLMHQRGPTPYLLYIQCAGRRPPFTFVRVHPPTACCAHRLEGLSH
jgi:hypothetical protein